MKYFSLIVVVIFLLLAAPLWASRARVITMGSGDPTGIVVDPNGNGGSFYYDTAYSVFINPAYLNDSSDQLIFEKSNNPKTTAQGAFIKSVGPLKTGLFLGRTGDSRFYDRQNIVRPIELVAGSKVSNFGGGLSLSYFENVLNKKRDRSLDSKAGVSLKLNDQISIDPYFSWKLMGQEDSTPDKYAHRSNSFGFKANYEKFRWFSGYRIYYFKWNSGRNKQQIESYGSAISHQASPTPKTQIFYGTGYWRVTSAKRTIVPIFLAAEHTVLSWLTVRGGLDYRLWDVQKGQSINDNTTARIGLTAFADNFAFDWVIGSNTDQSGAAGAVNETLSQVDTQSFGFDGAFFTAAALRITF